MSRSKKGDRLERELVNMFDDEGFASIRIPASGGATKRELPDILAGDGNNTYAIEAKGRKDGPIYLDWKEIMDLLVFSNRMGVKARIGARYNREDWRFYHPAELYITDSCSRRVDYESDVEHETFEDLISGDGL